MSLNYQLIKNAAVICLFMFCSDSSTYGQAIIQLSDNIELEHPVSYTNFKDTVDRAAFNLSKLNIGMNSNIRIKSLRLHDFLWSGLFDKGDYNEIYFMPLSDSMDSIAFDMDGDRYFESNHTYGVKQEVVNLIFHSKREGVENITVPVIVKKDGGNITFLTFKLLAGNFHELPVTVWPYQFGVKISLGQEKFTMSEVVKYYEIGESFLHNQKLYRFRNFNYSRKTIEVEEVSGDQTLFGYKVGSIMEDWNSTKRIKWDSLGIKQDSPVLFYFGATWCGACVPAVKTLKTLNKKILEEKGIKLVSVITGNKFESKNDIKEFILTNQVPGIPVIEDWYNHNGLIDRFRTITYPSYIMLSARGEILYRSDYNDKSLNEFIYNYTRTK